MTSPAPPHYPTNWPGSWGGGPMSGCHAERRAGWVMAYTNLACTNLACTDLPCTSLHRTDLGPTDLVHKRGRGRLVLVLVLVEPRAPRKTWPCQSGTRRRQSVGSASPGGQVPGSGEIAARIRPGLTCVLTGSSPAGAGAWLSSYEDPDRGHGRDRAGTWLSGGSPKGLGPPTAVGPLRNRPDGWIPSSGRTSYRRRRQESSGVGRIVAPGAGLAPASPD